MEDGEVNDGFLGEKEMAERKALAAAHGDGTNISWVEAVILGARHLTTNDEHLRNDPVGDATGEQGDAGSIEHKPVPTEGDKVMASIPKDPPPPGTSAERPPLPSAALARREAALVHRVMAFLGEEGAESSVLLSLLAEAEVDGVDVPRWLGLGRSSNRGRTPLMEAAMQGQTACVAALADVACAGGCGLNSRNERGRYSALHYACYHGAAGAALELLVRGADPRLRNREGETALQAALGNGRTECAELVRDFLRRPTFEPDSDGLPFLPHVPPPVIASDVSDLKNPESKDEGREHDDGRKWTSGRVSIGGVAAVAPEVTRANTVFCLGRRRRRLGAGVRPGRGLGVGVGTAAAEVALGARRGARLHAINPCVGTPMEAYAMWAIPNGQDPFSREGGVARGAKARIGGEGEEEVSDWEQENEPRGTGSIWLGYYVRVYNESVQRWHDQHKVPSNSGALGISTGGHRDGPVRDKTKASEAMSEESSKEVSKEGRGEQSEGEEEEDGSAYALVVERSKAIEGGRRFELPCGSNVVVGRSQHRAGIVVKDELVSKEHLRVEVSVARGFRVCDMGSKHGAVITKPAPSRVPSPTNTKRTEKSSSNTTVSALTKAEGANMEDHRGAGANRSPAPGTGGDPTVTTETQEQPKFFPIPIPREPEWVEGAHDDKISLGKTILLVERRDGPRPPRLPRRRRRRAGTTSAGAGAGTAKSVTKPKKPATVISKVFELNPNLLDAIRSAEETERVRKRKAAESEMAVIAAAEYLNKRARSKVSHGSGAAGSTVSSGDGSGGSGSSLSSLRSERASSTAGVVSKEPGTQGVAGQDVNDLRHEKQQESSGSFDHVSKGSMLLKRMGWTEGQGLGRRSDGKLQPVQAPPSSAGSAIRLGATNLIERFKADMSIQVERRGEREGLGMVQTRSNLYAVGADGRISKWEQMRRRFMHVQSRGPGYGGSRRAGSGRGWLRGGVEGGSSTR